MSYSFEGNLRRRPEQNLSGSSKKQTREALIQRAHEERLKRQSERLRVKSAQTIQSYARSYLTRKHAKEEQRKLFDQDNEEKTIDSQLARLLFFYHPNADIVRMVSGKIFVFFREFRRKNEICLIISQKIKKFSARIEIYERKLSFSLYFIDFLIETKQKLSKNSKIHRK